VQIGGCIPCPNSFFDTAALLQYHYMSLPLKPGTYASIDITPSSLQCYLIMTCNSITVHYPIACQACELPMQCSPTSITLPNGWQSIVVAPKMDNGTHHISTLPSLSHFFVLVNVVYLKGDISLSLRASLAPSGLGCNKQGMEHLMIHSFDS
jgi:hypothetical protein